MPESKKQNSSFGYCCTETGAKLLLIVYKCNNIDHLIPEGNSGLFIKNRLLVWCLRKIFFPIIFTISIWFRRKQKHNMPITSLWWVICIITNISIESNYHTNKSEYLSIHDIPICFASCIVVYEYIWPLAVNLCRFHGVHYHFTLAIASFIDCSLQINEDIIMQRTEVLAIKVEWTEI